MWIILDCDEQCHFPEQFEKLSAWENEKPYRHVAISAPRFEYWLLMHLDEHPSKEKCMSDDYMQQRIPNFKRLPIGTTAITRERIMAALERANATVSPCCEYPFKRRFPKNHTMKEPQRVEELPFSRISASAC